MYSISWLRAPTSPGRVLLGGLLILLVGLGSGCTEENALLLTLRGESFVDTFDLKVKDLSAPNSDESLVLERTGEQVDPNDPNRDISQPGQALKISITFDSPGRYLLYIVGKASGTSQVALRDFEIDGVREESITLKTLTADIDGDNDGYPSCAAFSDCSVVGSALSCFFLDCDDSDPDTHPFAKEKCGDKKDNDCDRGCGGDPILGDGVCEDEDGDGSPSDVDCDDKNPCAVPGLKEAQKICGGLQPSDFVLPQVCLDWLAKNGKAVPAAPFCGDGIDQDCNGSDASCIVDKDCDGASPPDDCDDNNNKIGPNAPELCDGIDNNCNKVVDEGCVPCDVDSDGHAAPGATGDDCKDIAKDDKDDYDAGVFPSSTKETGGKEGGTVLTALREWCSDKLTKDGVRERDVDHDSDGRPASADCPDPNCDRDGDGFERSDPGAGCTPAKPDCNDNDPKVFPGAPDFCGDGKAQDCKADRPCTGDEDGDRYVGADDCDDKNAKRHPWATEICDEFDNDCDGLTNEGNPDHLGNLMKKERTCTYDDHGICAETKGFCACSKQKPKGDLDPNGVRSPCAAEDYGAPYSPRCFEAAVWEPEECDNIDHDCNNDPWSFEPGPGRFADQGKPCSIDAAECKQGTVIGCSQTPAPNAALYQSLHQASNLGNFNPHWVCSSDTDFPEAERCNGKDDDCMGGVPSNEVDGDGDGFIACSGCQQSDLANGLTGCGDCRPGLSDVFPGAPEQCNNRDDNCKSGTNDDGDTECTGAKADCCSGQSACRNLQNDSSNCGQCGKKCDGDDVDRCVGGNCVCGTTGGPCPAGLDCDGGVCRCIPNGRCGGCCDNNGTVCRTGNTAGDCGRNGATCKTCNDNNPCTTNQCNSSGQCAYPNATNVSTTCPSGVCINGSCCTGCRVGSNTCISSPSSGQCGGGGAVCQNCNDNNACTNDSCTNGSCSYSNRPNNSSCTGGVCISGSCCTGCVQGSTCINTQSPTRCGRGGVTCTSCVDGDPCTTDVCTSLGSCNNTGASPSGTSCTGGMCFGVNCCTGCIGNGACRTGNTNAYCGDNGLACSSCSTSNECRTAQCSNGGCTTPFRPDGTSCASGAGKCKDGNCCEGCVEGSNCRAGHNINRCGDNGDDCVVCPAAPVCQEAVCPLGSCGTQNLANGTSCNSGAGRCRSGACCEGCWDGATCQPGTADTACGTAGGTCVDCPTVTAGDVCKTGGSCGPP